MANPSVSFGARPHAMRGGGEIRASGVISVDALNSSAIHKNAFIKRDADGNASLVGPGESILGLAVMFRDSDGLPLSYLPELTAGEISYIPANDLLVSIAEDSDGGSLSSADIGNNVDIVAGTPNNTTGISGIMIDSSTKTTGSAQLRIEALDPTADNAEGTNARWICSVVEIQGAV